MGRKQQPQHPAANVGLGYVRVSSREQGDSGLGLAAQREAIMRAAEMRNMELLHVYADVGTGKQLAGRDELAEALKALAEKRASMLIVRKLDRLGRSLRDILSLFERARDEGWDIKILELDLDTSTPTGRFVMQMFGALAEMEGAIISQRTKDAMDQIPRTPTHVNAAGEIKQRPGAPIQVSEQTLTMILRLHQRGKGYREIVKELDALGIEPPMLAKWRREHPAGTLPPIGQRWGQTTLSDRWSRATVQKIIERHQASSTMAAVAV